MKLENMEMIKFNYTLIKLAFTGEFVSNDIRILYLYS